MSLSTGSEFLDVRLVYVLFWLVCIDDGADLVCVLSVCMLVLVLKPIS
jgi:hypothetical protein